jgi:HK97 gp10 family phage protein
MQGVQGLPELRRALLDLPKELRGAPLASGVLGGAKIVREAAKAGVRKRTGLTQKAIRVFKERKLSDDRRAVYKVGVSMRVKGKRGVKKVKTWPPFYWRFIEFGTAKMAAAPFLEPAFAANQEAAVQQIKESLAKAIERAARKLGKG